MRNLAISRRSLEFDDVSCSTCPARRVISHGGRCHSSRACRRACGRVCGCEHESPPPPSPPLPVGGGWWGGAGRWGGAGCGWSGGRVV
eukprot:3475489-Prymnesium_polylepis.1